MVRRIGHDRPLMRRASASRAIWLMAGQRLMLGPVEAQPRGSSAHQERVGHAVSAPDWLAIRTWWHQVGRRLYPTATRLLITAQGRVEDLRPRLPEPAARRDEGTQQGHRHDGRSAGDRDSGKLHQSRTRERARSWSEPGKASRGGQASRAHQTHSHASPVARPADRSVGRSADMDEKWDVFVEDRTVFLHRSRAWHLRGVLRVG
jgi:hypothetical protein